MNLIIHWIILSITAMIFSIILLIAISFSIKNSSNLLKIFIYLLLILGILFVAILSFQNPIMQIDSAIWSLLVLLIILLGIPLLSKFHLKKRIVIHPLKFYLIPITILLSSIITDIVYIKVNIQPVENKIYNLLEEMKPTQSSDIRLLIILPHEYLDIPTYLNQQLIFAPAWRYSINLPYVYQLFIWQNDYPNIIQDCKYINDSELGGWDCQNIYLYK